MPQVGEPQVCYIGIDPGASGGLVALMGKTVCSAKMPDSVQGIWDWVSSKSEPFGYRAVACVESLSGYVGDGGNPGSRMFKMGTSYGQLLMALTAARIPYEQVAPQRWQKAMSIVKERGEDKRVWKNRLKERAQKLWPHVTVTLYNADALLLAGYCKLKHEDRL